MYAFPFIALVMVAVSAASPMMRPHFIRVGPPTDLDIAFMTAGHSIRSLFSDSTSDLADYCTNRQDIQMDYASLPAPSPGLTLYHVALGRGTQNYSCPTSDSSAAPLSLGALATLYNVTCLMTPSNKTIFQNLFTSVTKNSIPVEGNPHESGHHYFTNGNVTATFNLHTDYLTGNLGISYATKTANISAVSGPTGPQLGPDGSSPVPWLKLTTIGNIPKPPSAPATIQATDNIGNVKEVYRLNTAGGAAPKTCEGHEGKNFTQQYAAEYWFLH